MKTEVYSWRVSSELKSELEREARLRKVSISAIVDSAVRHWLQKNPVDQAEDAEQRRLHRAAEGCFGVLSGQNPRRAETARESIRMRLGRRNAR
jgi:predicted transcriptional regulator